MYKRVLFISKMGRLCFKRKALVAKKARVTRAKATIQPHIRPTFLESAMSIANPIAIESEKMSFWMKLMLLIITFWNRKFPIEKIETGDWSQLQGGGCSAIINLRIR